MSKPFNDSITSKEAVAITGLSIRRIRQLCETGKLAAVKFGRDWLISRASVEAYKERREKR